MAKKSSMNILPIIIVLGIIVLAGYPLLKGNVNAPWQKKDKKIQITRMEGFPRTWETQKNIKKSYRVIQNQAELEEFFNYADLSSDQNALNSILSNVNFNKEQIIAVVSDVQEELGSQIKIKKIEEDKKDKTLKVTIFQIKPDDTCIPEVKNNVLIDIIKIDKTNYKIEFDSVKQTKSCD